MSPPIRLISTDFDGTLYSEFSRPHVPDVLQEMIRELQEEGAAWVINTGRDLSSLMEGMARCKLRIKPDYLVVVEREIYVHERSQYVEVEDWNKGCRQAHAALFKTIAPDLPALITWVQNRFKATIYEDTFSPFCLTADTNEEADALCASLDEYCSSIPNLSLVRNDVYARFSHDSYNKGTALGEIARRIGAPASSVLAAGDHYNDLPMLARQFAGFLVAPDNAIGPVKELVRQQQGFVSSFSCGHGVADGLSFHLGRPGFISSPPGG